MENSFYLIFVPHEHYRNDYLPPMRIFSSPILTVESPQKLDDLQYPYMEAVFDDKARLTTNTCIKWDKPIETIYELDYDDARVHASKIHHGVLHEYFCDSDELQKFINERMPTESNQYVYINGLYIIGFDKRGVAKRIHAKKTIWNQEGKV